MNPINSQSLYSSLQRMADQAQQSSLRNAQPNLPGSGEGGGFSAVMKGMAQQVNSVQAEATQKANDFSLGKPDADLAEAMIAMQRARVHFESMVQVRNKLVSAYQEVMRMPV